MKKFILLNLTFCCLLTFHSTSYSQNAIDDFISYYKDYADAHQLSFPGFIARIGIDIAAKEEPALQSFSDRISSLRLFIVDQHIDGLNSDLHAQADYRAHLITVMARRGLEMIV